MLTVFHVNRFGWISPSLTFVHVHGSVPAAMQVPLKVWRRCSKLAATSNFLQQTGAVYAAYALFGAVESAGILPQWLPDGTVAPVLGTTAKRMAATAKQQLLDSGLLQQLPALLTDAALQLQAVAGLQPATDVQRVGVSEAARGVPDSPDQAAYLARNVVSLMHMVHRMTPVYTANSSIGASCVPPTEHMALAIWQYLSTVPALQPDQQDGGQAASSGQHSTVLTDTQLKLSSGSWQLAEMCLKLATAALNLHPSIVGHAGRAGRTAAQRSTPETRTAQAAVSTRHHLECVCFIISTLQLVPMIKSHQQSHLLQQQASSSTISPAAKNALCELAGRVPAPLQMMLRQLGCSTHAALWQALQFIDSRPAFSTTELEYEFGWFVSK
jgi:hypothetical protein